MRIALLAFLCASAGALFHTDVALAIGASLDPGYSITDRIAEAVAKSEADALARFWWMQAAMVVAFFGLSWITGLLVQKRGWQVGYTRKILALALYALPSAIAVQYPAEWMIWVATMGMGSFLLCTLAMVEPLRSRAPFLATCFAAIDRPEDRPFTIAWLSSAVIATWAVVVLWIWLAPTTVVWLFVAFFIAGIGDALAEPVGLRFGKHKYVTRALGTDRLYTRSLEGSAVVFLSGAVGVLIVTGFTLTLVSVLALLLFPLVGAITEARSPHTWDQPFIIATSGVVAVLISLV